VTDEQYGVSILIAAQRLGLSEGAVRQRIRRKTLDARRINGRTYVVLPPSPNGFNTHHEPSVTDVPPSVTLRPEQQLEMIRDTLLVPLITEHRQAHETIAEQAKTIGRLEERVDTLQAKLDAVEAIPLEAPAAPETPQIELERPWWQFWKRL